MSVRAIILLASSCVLLACAQDEPEADAGLPVRYAEMNLADIATADALTARCAEEEALFREHFAIVCGPLDLRQDLSMHRPDHRDRLLLSAKDRSTRREYRDTSLAGDCRDSSYTKCRVDIRVVRTAAGPLPTWDNPVLAFPR